MPGVSLGIFLGGGEGFIKLPVRQVPCSVPTPQYLKVYNKKVETRSLILKG